MNSARKAASDNAAVRWLRFSGASCAAREAAPAENSSSMPDASSAAFITTAPGNRQTAGLVRV